MTNIRSVADVATILKLKPKKVAGSVRFIGANPTGSGATKDGFTLFEAGNAMDNNGERFTSPQVAGLAGLTPEEYEPCVRWAEKNGKTPRAGARSSANGSEESEPEPFDWENATLYDYTDEEGNLLVQVGKLGTGDTKRLNQRRPNGKGGWVFNQTGVPPLLLLLETLKHASVVWLVEGEKAAVALNAAFKKAGIDDEYIAPTHRGAAGYWPTVLNKHFTGKTLYVLPDNDNVGANHARKVLDSLLEENADLQPARFCCVTLPNQPAKADVYDWLEAGNPLGELIELAEATPQWSKVTKEEEDTPEPAIESKGPKFNYLTLNQLELRPVPQWLIHRFLTVGGTSLLTAKHGSFKSFFALDMALCIATGTLWQGFEVNRGRVVYVAAEGASGLTKRAKAWQRRHRPETEGNFLVLDAPLKVHEEGVRQAFIQSLVELKPALIVLDTLARCAVGLDENSASDMSIFADAIGEIASKSGAHVMVVHHNNKTGEYRGSTVLPAAVDTHLSLERTGSEERNTVTLRIEKQKDFEAWQPLGFEGNTVQLSEHSEETSLVFEPCEVIVSKPAKITVATTDEKVLEVLESITVEGGVTSPMWEAASTARGISRATFFRSSKNLIEGTEYAVSRVAIVAGEKGGQGQNAARYAPKDPTSLTSLTSLTGLVGLVDNSTEKLVSPVSPPFRGETVDTGLEVVAEELKLEGMEEGPTLSREQKGKKKRPKANAESEPYAALNSSEADAVTRDLLVRSMS